MVADVELGKPTEVLAVVFPDVLEQGLVKIEYAALPRVLVTGVCRMKGDLIVMVGTRQIGSRLTGMGREIHAVCEELSAHPVGGVGLWNVEVPHENDVVIKSLFRPLGHSRVGPVGEIVDLGNSSQESALAAPE